MICVKSGRARIVPDLAALVEKDWDRGGVVHIQVIEAKVPLNANIRIANDRIRVVIGLLNVNIRIANARIRVVIGGPASLIANTRCNTSPLACDS